jgi:hypothetical protein
MEATQLRYDPDTGWSTSQNDDGRLADSQLVLLFGDRLLLDDAAVLDPIRRRFPAARVVTCSTGGEICGNHVLDNSVVATALRFVETKIVAVERDLSGPGNSFASGYGLAQQLPVDGLRHVLLFSEGLNVNGSALADGLAKGLPSGVAVTGGLAADGERFEKTLIGLDNPPASGRVVAIGLYGDKLRVGMGSLGGWENVGDPILVTRSEGNVLFELEGRPALPLYKQQIGTHAYALPASGLLHPLNVLSSYPGEPGVVRTLLSVNEQANSLTFAGDVPEGRFVQLMKANLDRLIDAAGDAASRSLEALQASQPDFVLLVSCIGRKLLLQRRTDEEVQSARKVFGDQPIFAGFYSYGELSPMTPSARCELHNQTMTITTLSEKRVG